MSKIKLTGSNSGYVEISSAADAGNLTLALPTNGTELLSNGNNVYTGITTFSNDVKFEGASYDAVWDKSDNQLEFADNAKLSFGAPDIQIYHDSSDNISKIDNLTSNILQIRNLGNNKIVIKPQNSFPVELYFNNNKKIETTNTGAVITGICTATSFSGDGSALSNTSHRRLNYNGAMMINQRGNATGVTVNGYYCCDRYNTQMEASNSGTWSITQAADVPDGYGFKYSYEYGCTATSNNANRYLMTIYRMEGVDSQVFNYGTANAKTLTLSFWIKCSKAGNFQVNFENEQNPDAGYQTQQTINSAGQWEKKVVTIPGDTTKAFTFGTQKAMCIDIVYSAFGNYASQTPTAAWSALANEQRGGHCNMDLFDSTSNYVKITGVQLEIGSTATEFEHIPYADELARCQRYYEGVIMGTGTALFRTYLNNAGGGSNVSNVEYNFKVEKRATPSWSLEGNATWYPNGTSGMNAYPSTSACLFQRNDSTAQFLTDANGDLCGSFSCEI